MLAQQVRPQIAPIQSAKAVEVAYDYRFNSLRFHVDDDRIANGHLWFIVSLTELFGVPGIHLDEVKAAMALAKEDTPTAYGDIEPFRLKTLQDTNWVGKTVLDVGGYDGCAAAEALAGGAKAAICLDNHQYEHYGWEEKKKPGVLYLTGDFMLWDTPADVVIFYNVLYHLKNPWQALDHLRTITREEMLLCTLFRYADRPYWYLYEPRECNPQDETVYWGPSLSGLERMLTATGWTYVREGLALDRVVYRCKPIPGFQEGLWKA